jgi:hypothetical protein
MARPVVSDLAELFYEELGFHRDDDEATDWTLLRFNAGWVEPIEPVYELVRERDDGTPSWGILFDVDECPTACLPYLAQYAGCVLTPEMSEEQIRNEIREPTGWRRGQPESIRIALRRTLTGEEPLVIIRPRTPEVGHHYIRTMKSQTPDPERTERVLREKIPAWEMLDYAAIDATTFADIAAGWETFDDLAAAQPTFKDLAEVLPTELPE